MAREHLDETIDRVAAALTVRRVHLPLSAVVRPRLQKRGQGIWPGVPLVAAGALAVALAVVWWPAPPSGSERLPAAPSMLAARPMALVTPLPVAARRATPSTVSSTPDTGSGPARPDGLPSLDVPALTVEPLSIESLADEGLAPIRDIHIVELMTEEIKEPK